MRVEQKTKISDASGERSEPKMREGERRRKYWCEKKRGSPTPRYGELLLIRLSMFFLVYVFHSFTLCLFPLLTH